MQMLMELYDSYAHKELHILLKSVYSLHQTGLVKYEKNCTRIAVFPMHCVVVMMVYEMNGKLTRVHRFHALSANLQNYKRRIGSEMGWKMCISAAILVLAALTSEVNQAQASCVSRGGSLVEIENTAENDAIYGYIQNQGWTPHFWIGLKIHVSLGNFSWISDPDVLPTYFNWALYEPMLSMKMKTVHKCKIVMDNGMTSRAIKQYPTSVRKIPVIRVSCEEKYGPNWVTLNTSISDKCYHFSKNDKNYAKTVQYCDKKGGTLVIIGSEAENNMLWLAMKDLRGNTNNNRWLGLMLEHSGSSYTLEWIPDPTAPTTYTNFFPGEPNNNNNNEECVQMLKADGKWNDMPCSKTQKCICQRDPPTCDSNISIGNGNGNGTLFIFIV
ncbi:hypothetical protein ScPMuIL_013219 [Solemya velum]